MLGPAKSTKQVFERLDRQYSKQKKSAIWPPLEPADRPAPRRTPRPLPVKGKE
jgi:hypothetical protein